MIYLDRIRIFSAILAIPLLLASCASAPKEVQSDQAAPAETTSSRPASQDDSASTMAVGHGSGEAPPMMMSKATQDDAGVKWTAPSRWESKPAGGMRAATYMIPAASGDSEGAECAVFKNIGGGVQANIDRWIGQFEKTDAKPVQKKETINGFAVTTVDASGPFKGGGPMMGQAAGTKPGYRLLGAIVETPQGEVFFKLTGLAKTVAAAQSEFQAMLKSLKN
jgi:hypothetical protein